VCVGAPVGGGWAGRARTHAQAGLRACVPCLTSMGRLSFLRPAALRRRFSSTISPLHTWQGAGEVGEFQARRPLAGPAPRPRRGYDVVEHVCVWWWVHGCGWAGAWRPVPSRATHPELQVVLGEALDEVAEDPDKGLQQQLARHDGGLIAASVAWSCPAGPQPRGAASYLADPLGRGIDATRRRRASEDSACKTMVLLNTKPPGVPMHTPGTKNWSTSGPHPI
jgi:hypothetical protein